MCSSTAVLLNQSIDLGPLSGHVLTRVHVFLLRCELVARQMPEVWGLEVVASLALAIVWEPPRFFYSHPGRFSCA